MKRTSFFALVAAVLVLGADLATAAPKQLVSDPKGDAPLDARLDILSAHLTTTGTTKKVRGRSVYTPTHLVASVTTAGRPASGLGQQLTFIADVPDGCGSSEARWSMTTVGGPFRPYNGLELSRCGKSFVPRTVTRVSGNTATWTTPMPLVLKAVDLGTVLTNLRVYADQGDPVLGFSAGPHGLLRGDEGIDLAVDTARSKSRYVLR